MTMLLYNYSKFILLDNFFFNFVSTFAKSKTAIKFNINKINSSVFVVYQSYTKSV